MERRSRAAARTSARTGAASRDGREAKADCFPRRRRRATSVVPLPAAAAVRREMRELPSSSMPEDRVCSPEEQEGSSGQGDTQTKALALRSSRCSSWAQDVRAGRGIDVEDNCLKRAVGLSQYPERPPSKVVPIAPVKPRDIHEARPLKHFKIT